jgi:MFS family permease
MASSIKTFLHYRNVVVLAFGNLVVMFGFSMFSPLMPIYLLPIVGGALFIVGLFTSLFSLMRALLQPFTGRLSDKIGRKKMIVPALFSYSFVAYLYSTATTAFEFIGYRAVQGISSSTLWPASDALISDTVPTRERARALGAVSMTYQVGTLIAPAIGGLVAYAWGFKEVFYVCALLSLAGGVASLLFLREPRKAVTKQQPNNPVSQVEGNQTDPSVVDKAKGQVSSEQQFDLRQSRRVIRFLGLTSSLVMMTFSMIEIILPILIIYYYGGTMLDVGLIYVSFGLAGALAAVMGGSLADKHGRRRILLTTTALSVMFWPAFLVINMLSAFFAVNALLVFVVIMTLFSFVGTMGGPSVSALVADLTPPEKRGANFGFLGMCNDLGLVIGPIIGGLLADFVNTSLNLGLLGGLQALFIMNAFITTIATLVILVGVREPKKRY